MSDHSKYDFEALKDSALPSAIILGNLIPILFSLFWNKVSRMVTDAKKLAKSSLVVGMIIEFTSDETTMSLMRL